MTRSLSIALLLGSVLQLTAADQVDQDLSAFKLRDGYEVSLFASEKDGITKPIQMRFDPQGRLWVACSTIYPQLQPGQKPSDKIVVIEDRDRDGKADKSTVFADGLMIPTGLEFGDNGLYVGTTTRLLHFADTNGDLRGDQQRVVLRGFGTGDSHQNINSFCWSPGGQLFMSQGLHAFSDVETPHGIVRLHEAGIWRFTPGELRLEPFFGDGMTPHNPWGFVWDDWLTPFMVAGNGDGIYYLSPCLVGTRHRREFQRIFKQGNKYCGVDLVGTAHLPPDLQGKLIAGGFMNNRIVVFRLEEEGSGFSAKEEQPLMVSTNVTFRPVDVKVGPDGAIYVADWYNPIIGHYQASFRDPRRDKEHGRIWRITAKGRPLVRAPELATASTGELLNDLTSTERWVRYEARRVLADRKTTDIQPALDSWVASLLANKASNERALMEALAVYEMFNLPQPKLLAHLLTAKDYRARAYATEVVGRWQAQIPNALEVLAAAVRDPHPRVRLQAVVAASRIPQERSIEVALAAVNQPVDRFIEDALVQTVFALRQDWLPALIAGRLALTEKPLEYLLKTDASADTLQATVRLLNNPKLDRSAHSSLLMVLASVGGPSELGLLLDPSRYNFGGQYDANLHARVLNQLRASWPARKIKPSGNLEKDLPLQSSNLDLRSEAIRLAGLWKLQSFRPDIERIAASRSEPDPLRCAAIESLGYYGGALSVITPLTATDQSSTVRAATIKTQLSFDPKASSAAAATLLAKPAEDSLVDDLFGAFLARPAAISSLVESLNAQKPSPDAAKIGLRKMSAVGRADERLSTILSEAAGLQRDKKQLGNAEIAALAGDVRKDGNPSNGAKVYARPELNCSACHTINGKGGNVGPDLSALGTGQPIEFIIGAILYPNREVKEGFTAFEITTKDGESHQGYITSENAQELAIKDVAIGKEIRLAKKEIASRTQRGSVMPDGLVDTLTQSEFRDLVRFLSELGR